MTILSRTPKPVFLKNNGVELKRLEKNDNSQETAPTLLVNKIKKPQSPIPEIASIEQPFPSFGGKQGESRKAMNKRVSTRLKTKGRVVNLSDFFRVLKEGFSDIYYSNSIFDKTKGTTTTYVIRSFKDDTLPNAYTPLFSACKLGHIESYLRTMASPVNQIIVSNFGFQYVVLHANIIVDSVFDAQGILEVINNKLHLYLSPWIESKEIQRVIGTPVTIAEVVQFLKTIKGINRIENAFLSSYVDGVNDMIVTKSQQILPRPGFVLVRSELNNITISCENKVTAKTDLI